VFKLNWDLLLGLVVGLSGSILSLIGTIVTNKQNHEHELEVINKKHEHEVKTSIRNHVLENSFKDYELKSKMALDMSEDTGQGFKLYPYDMYILSYMKIAEYMNKEDHSPSDLGFLLSELDDIKREYDNFQQH